MGISFQGKRAQVSELIYADTVRIESIGVANERRIQFNLPPGELRLIKIEGSVKTP